MRFLIDTRTLVHHGKHLIRKHFSDQVTVTHGYQATDGFSVLLVTSL